MSKDQHDWHKMLNEYEHNPELYDRVDMKNKFDIGFCIGAISGAFLTIVLCLLVGLYFNGWQLP